MGQGQPREIIWTILVVLTYTMLHTKFQGHRSIGSGEEDFLRFLPYMGMAAILVMWPEPFEQLFVPLIPGGYIWNLVTIGPVVSEEKSFEIVDGRRRTTDDDDDGRRTTTDDGACLYYKLPRSLRLRWAKNKSLCDQIWPWRKMGQGQPRVIIWTTLVELSYTMLHTKFQGHRSIGSGEEDFLRFLPYMGMAAMLVMWPNSFI